MTALQALGALLAATPFIVVTALMVIDGGWRIAIAVWAITAAVAGMTATGVYLLTGGGA